jgi:hypothetical protein
MRRLEHGVDLHGEGAAALVALVCSDAGRSTIEAANAIGPATVRAHWAGWPHALLDELVSRRLIVEVSIVQNRLHRVTTFDIFIILLDDDATSVNGEHHCLW